MDVANLLTWGGQVAAFGAGFILVWAAMRSAVRTLVFPRPVSDPISWAVFNTSRAFFQLRLRWAKDDAAVDRIMAGYAPVSVLMLLPSWLLIVLIGFMGMYWGIGIRSVREDFLMSGSSLFTLGYASVNDLTFIVLSFVEATIGLILVALLIAYLPAMYSAFSRREAAVSQLAARAGTPPSAVELIIRLHRIGELGNLRSFWREWEVLFSEIEESHTSLAALVFFRSPNGTLSWVTASGTVLDAAALIASTLELPREPQAELCIRAGFIALRRIAQSLDVTLPVDPRFPAVPISISQREYNDVCAELANEGVRRKPDREQTWRNFAGWRVNYDAQLLALCSITAAPYAHWSADRAPSFRLRSIRPWRRKVH